ncbi:hypothetical protein PMI42_03270 [Bradyrhizobium sp. YR681]|nr:hypothetical protein [Bradyrhizobium sp. YR681]EJN13414.1 hypothetical protein PMI42_03270 [Bradyrhizobium sp. YR681]
MQTILDVILFTAGFAACWFCKDPVLRFVTGTEALIKSLEARLAVLRAKS